MGKSKISYSWVINGFDAKISHDSKDNVIYAIHWSYNAKMQESLSGQIALKEAPVDVMLKPEW
jgi:hypothetical protein